LFLSRDREGAVGESESGQRIVRLTRRLPTLEGRRIRIEFRPEIHTPQGQPVHAASDIRRRRIYLERALRAVRAELARVLVHELFHFVWVRLGNPVRWSWEALLQDEWRARAMGELGFSAEWCKQSLKDPDVAGRSRRWREYACESFCDSAAWFYSPSSSPEHRLAQRWRRGRAEWFRNSFPAGERIPL